MIGSILIDMTINFLGRINDQLLFSASSSNLILPSTLWLRWRRHTKYYASVNKRTTALCQEITALVTNEQRIGIAVCIAA